MSDGVVVVVVTVAVADGPVVVVVAVLVMRDWTRRGAHKLSDVFFSACRPVQKTC